MDTLKIAATANGVNYLPEYLAGAAGLFTDAGLAVETTPKDPWTGVIDDLESGAADLALGGLWVPAMYAGSSRELTVVCQLNHQFPMGILLREPTAGLPAERSGRQVAAGSRGGRQRAVRVHLRADPGERHRPDDRPVRPGSVDGHAGRAVPGRPG